MYKITTLVMGHLNDVSHMIKSAKDDIRLSMENLETMSPSDDLRCAMAHLRSALDKLGEI
jgi:hypothetical protein